MTTDNRALIEEARTEHHAHEFFSYICRRCWKAWPCAASRLADALETAEAAGCSKDCGWCAGTNECRYVCVCGHCIEAAEDKAAPKDNEALRLRILRAAQDCPLGRNLTEFESVSFTDAVMPIVDAETRALRGRVEIIETASIGAHALLEDAEAENETLRKVIDRATKLADEWEQTNAQYQAARVIGEIQYRDAARRLRNVLAVPETTQEQQ